MSFHEALRVALVAHLKTADLGAPVFSSPPANMKPPVILVGAISAGPTISKDGPGAFYSVGVETWVQSMSPLDLDRISDAIARHVEGAQLTSPDAIFSTFDLTSEADTFHPDAPGGPTLARIQTFSVFADAED